MPSTCPVCGWPELREPPRGTSGGGSYEICPSCGFEFGVSDDDAGCTYEVWRQRWLAAGARWAGRGQKPPKDWDAHAQLAALTTRKGPRPKR